MNTYKHHTVSGKSENSYVSNNYLDGTSSEDHSYKSNDVGHLDVNKLQWIIIIHF